MPLMDPSHPGRGFRLPPGSREHVIRISPPDPVTGKTVVTFRAKGVETTLEMDFPSPYDLPNTIAFEKRLHDHVVLQNS